MTTKPFFISRASTDSKLENQMFSQEKSSAEKLLELKKYLEELSPTYLPNYYDFTKPEIDIESMPLSYRNNTSLEIKCIEFADVFRKQYKTLFKYRKRLLINPRNECNVKKFICTYICPVQWPYPELYDWKGAANFVSDHLNFIHLLPTTEIPDIIYSSTTILKLQKGNCFDFTNLLCSLLIGVGYDAYIVSGYATRECCYMDQTRTSCPLLEKPKPFLPNIVINQESKYTTKSLKTFRSKYDMNEVAKEITKKRRSDTKKEARLIKEKIEAEVPLPDPLHGVRVHSWILIKAGQRDIKEDFFIEALTGTKVDFENDLYLGVESLWNDKNYWVNKYCCINGVKFLTYDLKDLSVWEPLLIDEDVILNNFSKKSSDDDEENSFEAVTEIINIPLSWVRNLKLDLKTYEKRFPGYQKVKNYKNVQEFRYSPYYCLSGLSMRIKIFQDREYTKLLEVQEFLDNREDKHFKTVIKDGWVTEHFTEGNQFYLKEHSFLKAKPGRENDRELIFYENTRVDGLSKKVETPTSIEEFYQNRNDFLHYMLVKFYPRNEDEDDDFCYREIVSIVKKYLRNPSKSAEDDIMELSFLLSEDKISIIYHRSDGCIISSKRDYVKPSPSSDGRNIIHLYPDTHTFFASNNSVKPKTNLEVYELLRDLMIAEKVAIDKVHLSENDTKTILKGRFESKKKDKITISLYDTMRNIEAKKVHKMIDRDYHTNADAKEEILDFLNPYFAQQSITKVTTKEQAFQIRESCLYDLKQRLIHQANLIRNRFEMETDTLQKKQTWYYQNKMVLSLEEENKYLAYCSDAVSLLDTLENLLTRHKQSAPHKYMELERRIQKDPRLSNFLK